MRGYQCEHCQYKTMAAIRFCPHCHKQSFLEKDFPNNGEVYSYTTIHVAPPEFVQYAPYNVALISLTNNVKVTAFIQEEITIGDQVQWKENRDQAYIFERMT